MKLLMVFFAILLHSCSTKPQMNKALADKIATIVDSKDVEVFQGISSGNNGTHPFVDISISDAPVIDNDSLFDIANFASTCAIMTYDYITESNRNNTTIDVNITRRQNGEDEKFIYQYDLPTIKIVISQIAIIDTVVRLWSKKSYDSSYTLFDEKFKITTSLEKFTSLLTRAEEELGPVKKVDLEGFRIVEMNINGKMQKLVKFKTTFHRDSTHTINFFLEPNYQLKILGIDM